MNNKIKITLRRIKLYQIGIIVKPKGYDSLMDLIDHSSNSVKTKYIKSATTVNIIFMNREIYENIESGFSLTTIETSKLICLFYPYIKKNVIKYKHYS